MCSCKIEASYKSSNDGYIIYCPLHAAAEELLDALELVGKLADNVANERQRGELQRVASAAIANARRTS